VRSNIQAAENTKVKTKLLSRLEVLGVGIRHSFTGLVVGATLAAGALPAGALASAYTEYPAYEVFAAKMVEEHQFDEQDLQKLFGQAKKQQSILDAMARPAEKTKPWKEYRKHFLTHARTENGIEFAQQHAAALQRAEQQFGVPREVIVAIIGVETLYGRNTGRHRVLDALSTLAFDYPARSKFFTSELEQYLLLTREQQLDPLELKGSYAGAMGLGQFIASSYRNYAIDFDGDGITNILDNPVDAIGSVANYFNVHGWQQTRPVVSRARIKKDYDESVVNQSLKPTLTVAELAQKGITPLAEYPATELATAMMLQGDHGAEFWIGLKNFYVITRYNHSKLYAMAVFQLSQDIKRGLR